MWVNITQVSQLHGWDLKYEGYDYQKRTMDSRPQQLFEGDDKIHG